MTENISSTWDPTCILIEWIMSLAPYGYLPHNRVITPYGYLILAPWHHMIWLSPPPPYSRHHTIWYGYLPHTRTISPYHMVISPILALWHHIIWSSPHMVITPYGYLPHTRAVTPYHLVIPLILALSPSYSRHHTIWSSPPYSHHLPHTRVISLILAPSPP